MKATDVLQSSLTSTQFLFMTYLSDLTDGELLIRPVPEANHIAWQIGHLITAEVQLGASVPGVKYPELPVGFAEQHSKDTSSQTDAKGFLRKAAYLDLSAKVRAATVAAVAALSDADLDKPNSGRMAQFAPTIGALVLLIANHTMMHGGQFAVLRRKLGKPILM